MQFVQTNMGEQMSRRIVDATGGYLKMEDIVNGTSFHTLFGIKCYTTCSFFFTVIYVPRLLCVIARL